MATGKEIEPQDEVLSSTDFLAEGVRALRNRRRKTLLERLREAREPKDVLALQQHHIESVLSEADIIKEAALRFVEENKEEHVAPTGGKVDTELTTRGLKTVGEIVNQQNESVSVVLGMATKITGNMSRVDVHRHQVTESIIHDSAGPDAELEDFEVEPMLTLPPGQAAADILEGEVE